MPLKGTVYLITDVTAAFLAILDGKSPPSGSYSRVESPLLVRLTGSPQGIPFFTWSTSTNTNDGSFQLPDLPFENIEEGWINIFLHGHPVYRTAKFHVESATGKHANDVWIYQPRLPDSAGFTAGQVSTALDGFGLPGNTEFKVGPNGLRITGSEGQANVEFGIFPTPDITPNLSAFIDLNLNGWDISVGWPTDWCVSAGDILNDIRSHLSQADSTANKLIVKQLLTFLEGPPINLTSGLASKLLDSVSIQFEDIKLPVEHSWGIGNKKDDTVIMRPSLVVGFPRKW